MKKDDGAEARSRRRVDLGMVDMILHAFRHSFQARFQTLVRRPVVTGQYVQALLGILVFSLLATTSAQAESGRIGPDYRIGAEDMLEISVWKEPDLQREVLVRPDGGISFPLAGDVTAAGKTPREVETILTQRIRRYVPQAVVTVSVKKVAGYTIFVIGKVANPGQFVLGRYVDVIQALTLAGGLTPFASEGKIKILRTQNGKKVVFRFDYGDVKKGRNLEQNLLLQSGDVVVVP